MKRNILSVLACILSVVCYGKSTLPVMKDYVVYDVDVEELSGLCMSADGTMLLSCGDNGVVKTISFDGKTTEVLLQNADMEGITLDPSTGDIYLAIEGRQEIFRMTPPDYAAAVPVFAVKEAIENNYRNGGLEAVEYYKDDILFVGSQTEANLWQYSLDGKMLSKVSLSEFASEIAGLCYDPVSDQLWVTDSNRGFIYLCTPEGSLLNTYDVSYVENLESICVDRSRNCVWVGSDEENPKLYRLDFEFPAKEYVVVAYVTSWSRVIPDPFVMTHINYAFGHVNDSFDGLRIDNSERLKRIADLKSINPDLKVMLSVGGWGSGRFSEMAADSIKRKSFAEDCLKAVEEFGLDGIDIDWEYPASSSAGISSSPSDRENFNLLMRDLRSVLGQDRLLTLASSAYAEYIDFRSCIRYLDFVNIMTYDMANAPYHHAPLYASDNTKGTCVGAVKAHMDAGVPASMLVLGMPFYGRGGTMMPKFVDYNDITVTEGLQQIWDEQAQAPYLSDMDGNLVLGYDTPRSLRLKSVYVKEHGLLGAMYWEYAGDKESGELQKTIAEEFLSE